MVIHAQCYLHAYRLQPSNPLASLGLRKLYEKDEQWEKLGSFLEVLVQAAYYESV
jgi:superkiller protein 3